jgi:AmpD protein
MKLDPGTGWLEGVRRVPSPNCDERPPGSDIDLLVVHSISLPPGEFGGPHVDALFTNSLDPAGHADFREIQGLRVSAHLLVRRDGGVIQYVSFLDRAWHAGQSCFEGRERCNDFSIGIELEGSDNVAFEPPQYERLGEIIVLLRGAWPSITPERIVGHSDIAPGRKADPGPAFDWQRLRTLLRGA